MKGFVRNIVVLLLVVATTVACNSPNNKDFDWMGTWYSSQQLVEPHNTPPDPGLTNNTLRQIVRVSIGGKTIRVKFSNLFSSEVLELQSIVIAPSVGGNLIDTFSKQVLTFDGQVAAEIPAGSEL